MCETHMVPPADEPKSKYPGQQCVQPQPIVGTYKPAGSHEQRRNLTNYGGVMADRHRGGVGLI